MNKYLIELYNCLYNDNININDADDYTIDFVQTIIYSSYEDYIKYDSKDEYLLDEHILKKYMGDFTTLSDTINNILNNIQHINSSNNSVIRIREILKDNTIYLTSTNTLVQLVNKLQNRFKRFY